MSGVKIKIQTTGMKDKIKNAGKIAQEAVSVQIAVDSNEYIPKEFGALEASVFADSNFSRGQIIWGVHYAVFVYYGLHMRLRTDKNRNASHLWFEVAKTQKIGDWMRLVSNVYKKEL